MIPIQIDHRSTTPIQRQIVAQLRTLIGDGVLLPGAQVPSTRALSSQLHVARNTVVLAYERLIAEGYLQARSARATYVSDQLPQSFMKVVGLNRAGKADPAKSLDRTNICSMDLQLYSESAQRIPLDFRVGRPDGQLFPTAVWRRLLLEALGGIQHAVVEYSDPAGHWPLRAALATHLRTARGIKADPEQIIIVTGCQQGLGMAGLLLDVAGTTAVLEDPCYRGAAYAFTYLGAKLKHVRVSSGDYDADQLPKEGARLAVVTPSHQFPLGYTMSTEQRERLLAWAEETGSYILEDDYDSDFRYDSSPLLALYGMDRAERVIYLGTFSKSIGPNLRLGYIVVPKHLAAPARATKAVMDNGHPWLEQMVVGEFMRSGAFQHHLVRIRRQYMIRRDVLMKALTETFGPSRFEGYGGGMHFVWHLPANLTDAYDLQQRARKYGVGIYSLRESPAYQDQHFVNDDRIVLLGYPCLNENSIKEAVRKLSRAAFAPTIATVGSRRLRMPLSNA